MKTHFSFFAICILSCSFVSAQSVGIGTVSPNANAILEVSSGSNLSKGILVTGTYSGFSASVPDLGAGSRMMFFPGRSAFRANHS